MSDVMNNYKEYLDSYSWKAIKKMKLEEKPECEVCGDIATSIHHLSYERLGKEKEDDIVSICESCHHECHYVDGYQIKNSEKELKKRFNYIKYNDLNNFENNSDKFLEEGEIDYMESDENSSNRGEYGPNGYFIKTTYLYTRDNNTVYYGNNKIDGADSKTFKVLESGYAIDKNYGYTHGKKIIGSDGGTFRCLDWGYAVDKYNVYDVGLALNENAKNPDSDTITGNIIIGADPSTFRTIDSTYQKDRYFKYKYGKKQIIASFFS